MEGKWRDVEVVVWEDLKLIKFEKLSIFKVYEFFVPCSGQLWLLAQHFTSNFFNWICLSSNFFILICTLCSYIIIGDKVNNTNLKNAL